MKGKFILLLLVCSLFLSTVIEAGTFENTDPDPKKYEATIDGVPVYGTIYGNSALYNFCNHGCALKLLDTGQTIQMQPGDHIIIDDGELKRQND